jgi:outer membrane lipoprotein-sorting protein
VTSRARVLTLALVFGSGCTTARPPVPASVTTLPTVETLAAALQHQREARLSLRALARMTYEGPDERTRARQVLLVERPQRLRIELLSALGTAFVLTAGDGTLAAYVRGDSAVYRGRATRANLQRYARVDLGVADAVELLLGTAPQRSAHHEVVSFDPTSGGIQLWRETDDGAQVIWFDRSLQTTATEDRDSEGRVQWRARFESFSPSQAGMPERIAIEVPADGRRLAFELTEMEINPELAATLFTLVTPPGATEFLLEDGAGALWKTGARS